MKKIKKVLVSVIVTLESDNRFVAKTKVDGEEVVALLDSGASANCIGNGASEFIKTRNRQVIPIQGQKVRTANGGETAVIDAMEFLIVPALQKEFYFGVDCWRIFGLSVISKCARLGVDATSTACVGVLKQTSSDLTFDTDLHVLTKEQEVALERVKAKFPSCAVLDLGRMTMEKHVIEVVDEHLPVKQRHYPISPSIQKLIFEKLDRFSRFESSWSSPVSLVRKRTKNRLCLDARKLNESTIKDAYPLPHIDPCQTSGHAIHQCNRFEERILADSIGRDIER